MKKRSFLSGAGVLAISVIFAKLLGACYRIPLANILGSEGMGLYQFVYPIFALLLTLSSGAMPTAVSITVSKRIAAGDRQGAICSFNVILRLCLIIGSIGTALLIVLAYPLSLLQTKDAFLGYLVISPAVLVVTVISAFRGYFMGCKNLVPSSISQITEGIIKLGVGITLSYTLLPYGLKYAVAGALIGVVASEIVTLAVMLIIFLRQEKGGLIKVKCCENKDTVKEAAKLVAPLIICGIILPLSQFVDSILLVNLLRAGGVDNPTGLYGVFSGAVNPLINLPVMVCITLGIAITPQMVEGRERKDIDFIMDKCNTATKIVFILGMPFLILFLFMPEGLISLFYPRLGDNLNLAGNLLRVSAVSVIGLSLFQIYSAMLQGLNKIRVPVYVMTVGVAVKTIVYCITVPYLGIVGASIGCAVGYSLAGVSAVIYFFRYVRTGDNIGKNISLTTLCGGIMGLAVFLASGLPESGLTTLLTAVGGVVIYVGALFCVRIFSREELKTMPLSKILIAVDKKINGV